MPRWCAGCRARGCGGSGEKDPHREHRLRRAAWDVGIENGALHHSLAGVLDRAPEATLSLPHLAFAALAGGNQTLDELIDAGEAKVAGDRASLDHLTENLDQFSFGFPIVTP